MKFRKVALVVLSTLMGVVWVVLLLSQLHLTRRVFFDDKQLFRVKVDYAVNKVLRQMETFPLIYLDSVQTPQRLSFEERCPFLHLSSDLSRLVNARLDFITETRPCLNSQYIDTRFIDSVFMRAFYEQQVFDPFVLGIYCIEEERLIYASSAADTAVLRSFGFDYPLLAYCYPDSFHNDILYVLFPELEHHYCWDMSLGIALLFVFLAAILLCFTGIIIMIVKQTKADKLYANFINHIIHEFKTPITTISLTTQLLKDESVQKDLEDSNSYLDMIDAEAQSLQVLVDEVLTVFRTEQLPRRKMHVVALHELLHHVVNIHQLALKDCGSETFLDLQAENDLVKADQLYLTNAFSNLIDNAIKYRDGKLTLTISTKNVGKMIEIRFKDNGIGISKENQGTIFEPFSRVNVDNPKYVKGYGLGLSYVRNVVCYHGGIIRVESELGKGATFIVSLPLKF